MPRETLSRARQRGVQQHHVHAARGPEEAGHQREAHGQVVELGVVTHARTHERRLADGAPVAAKDCWALSWKTRHRSRASVSAPMRVYGVAKLPESTTRGSRSSQRASPRTTSP